MIAACLLPQEWDCDVRYVIVACFMGHDVYGRGARFAATVLRWACMDNIVTIGFSVSCILGKENGSQSVRRLLVSMSFCGSVCLKRSICEMKADCCLTPPSWYSQQMWRQKKSNFTVQFQNGARSPFRPCLSQSSLNSSLFALSVLRPFFRANG